MQTKHHGSSRPLHSNKTWNNSPIHHYNKANHKNPPIILLHKTPNVFLGRDGKPQHVDILSYKNPKGQNINEVTHSPWVENTHTNNTKAPINDRKINSGVLKMPVLFYADHKVLERRALDGHHHVLLF